MSRLARPGGVLSALRGLAGLAAGLLSALVLAGCGEAARLDSLADQGRGQVVEVMSGDSVRLDSGDVVKLAGITAPRWDQPGGEAARQALAGLTLGQTVELLSAGAREDPFGRRLAQLRRVKGRTWVQGKLLEDGAVRVRTFADSRALAGLMLAHEARARQGRRGLWAGKDWQVRLPAEALAGPPGFVLVEGQVMSSWLEADGRRLDLGSGLVLALPARSLGDFDSAGLAPASLQGRLLRVRGYLGRDGEMRIDHPEAIEVLRDG